MDKEWNLQVHSCEITILVYHGHRRVDFLKVYLMAAHRYVLVLPSTRVEVSRQQRADLTIRRWTPEEVEALPNPSLSSPT